jgi:allantoinase
VSELRLKSTRVLASGGLSPAVVVADNGKISRILPYDSEGKDLGELVIMAGLVDTHVHLNEPGRTEWEGFATGTRAAAAGGITAVVDMPLNSIPVTTSAQALKIKLAAAERQCAVDCGFWGGVVPGNAGELEAMLDLGALGFKAFMCHSGIDDFPASAEEDLLKAMKVLARRGAPLLAHAELACGEAPKGPSTRYSDYLASRPKSWENDAIELLARLCAETGCRTHVVHLSSSEALPIVKRAKAAGLPFTAETCPHYLTLHAEEIEDGSTEFKCAPPIRESENSDRLWQALDSGIIDFVVSDHSPCVPQLKKREEGDFIGAWGGIGGLQYTLPAVWTEARRRGFDVGSVARWTSKGPAKFAGLANKGRLAPGADADLVVWDPDAPADTTQAALLHKNKLSPYRGRKLLGRVLETYVAGELVYDHGRIAEPQGRLLVPTHELR